MLIGRNAELNQLGNYYDREKSQIIVLYGEKYIGKTALIREFMEDKPGFYYVATPQSEREQKYRMGLWLAAKGIKTLKYPEFTDVFSCMQEGHTQKKVIVFDEFQNIVKSCPTFMDDLISFIHSSWNVQEYLVILSSSSIEFVENSMVSKIGEAAFELSGFLKIRPLKFKDLRDYFSFYTNEECSIVWSLFGGVPGLWNCFDQRLSLKDNIIRKIIASNGPLHNVGTALVTEELRETGVYNTILSALSEGKHKLNELYEHTQFSRAKISVYLKNLIELELVDKVFSVETLGHDHTQKGIYSIHNHFVDFTYTFLYRNASFLESMSAEDFYKTYVSPYLKQYAGRYFSDICTEYLEKQCDLGKISFYPESFGTWIGKQGVIDIVGKYDKDHAVLAICNFDKAMVTYGDYENLVSLANLAKLPSDDLYIFASGRFDEKLTIESKIRKNIHLVLLDRI